MRSVPGTSACRPRAGDAVPCHIIHRAMAAQREPFQQPDLGGGEIGVGNAYLVEAELAAPAANVCGERGVVPFATIRRSIGVRWERNAHAAKRTRSFPILRRLKPQARGWPRNFKAGCSSRYPVISARARPRSFEVVCGHWAGQDSVKSPSYTLVEHYPFSSLYFYHFDFYRFANSSEWETAGLADCFRDDSVCLVEWPERVAGLLPLPDLELTLTHPVDPRRSGRRLALVARTEAGERCLIAMTRSAAVRPT